MKLEKTITEFIKEKSKEAYEGLITFNHVGMQSEKYAKFITQELNIGMFVPAVFKNGEWVVLKEPELKTKQYGYDDWDSYYDEDEVKEYKEAKERVLFKGFNCSECEFEDYIVFEIGDLEFMYDNDEKKFVYDNGDYPYKNINTIEYLIPYRLELTETGEKKLKGEL